MEDKTETELREAIKVARNVAFRTIGILTKYLPRLKLQFGGVPVEFGQQTGISW